MSPPLFYGGESMSYNVHNFQTGEVIEAQQIQANEQAIGQRVQTSENGAANGVASLDGNGKVPSAQLPQNISVTDDNNGNVTFTF